jgi:hypothetical protein
VGLRGIGPALAGKLAGVWAFALRARDEGDRFQCSLRPDPAAAGRPGSRSSLLRPDLKRFWFELWGWVQGLAERWDGNHLNDDAVLFSNRDT